MRRLFFTFSIALLAILSSCDYYEDLEAYVEVFDTEEYETKEVTRQVYRNGVLVYEEFYYRTYVRFTLENTGDLTAQNVVCHTLIYDGNTELKRIITDVGRMRPGEIIDMEVETDFDTIHDYTDFEIKVYWQ